MPSARVTVALLAGVAAAVLTASLGNWQTRRGDEKAARQAHWDTALAAPPTPLAQAGDIARVAGQLPQRVQATGRFVAEATVYVNRIVDGVAGIQVITPLAIGEEAPWILVNRGWAARGPAAHGSATATPPPAAPNRVEGIAVERVPRVLELGEAERRLGGVWQNVDFDKYEAASGHAVARFVVQQTSDSGDGLRRVWQRPDAGVDKHRGYAFQWYALSALIVALTLFFGGRSLLRR
jgi:cytochrome oxidase assembly protein ShyY1